MLNFINFLVELENNTDDVFKFSKEELIEHVKDIQSNLISDTDNKFDGRHYGDCTKEIISCNICLYQNWLDKYEDYCRNYIKPVTNVKN